MVSISMGSLNVTAGRGARIIASVSRGWGETQARNDIRVTLLGVCQDSRPDSTLSYKKKKRSGYTRLTPWAAPDFKSGQ